MASRRNKKCSTVWLVVALGLVGLVFWLSGVSRANASLPYQAGGVDLDYVLTIDDPSSGQAIVIMTISNISTNTFEVEESGRLGLYLNVLSLSARDANGNPLVVEYFPDSGTAYAGQQADVWRVQCSGLSQIIIEYTVQPGLQGWTGWHSGYIAPDFAVFAGEHVFLIPRGSATSSIVVSFNLPTDWNAYIPWTHAGNSYNPAVPEAGVIDSLCESSFALGQFDAYTQTIGSTEVTVAIYAGWPADVKDKMAQRSFDIFAYLASVFGRSEGDYYLAFHNPPAADGFDIVAGEWSNSVGGSTQFSRSYWSGLAHGLFHRWNAWIYGMWGYYDWFCEGPNGLYEMKTITND